MIEVKKVSKKFGDVAAVKQVSFTIASGEVVGLLGPNGAGKTTLMRMITTFLEPTDGDVFLDGRDVVLHKATVKQHIGYLAENNPLYDEMLVTEYLKYLAALKGYSGAERKSVIARVVEQTGIESVYYRPVSDLSKGFRQRVGLAQAIIGEPDILILDEPTEGLDPNQRVDIRSLIKTLGKKKTVIVSTHVLSEATAMCDRLIILDQGRTVADGSVDSLQTQVDKNQRIRLEIESSQDVRQELLAVDGVVDIVSATNLTNRYQYIVLADASKQVAPLLFQAAKEKNWILWDLHAERASLENVFRNLTKKE